MFLLKVTKTTISRGLTKKIGLVVFSSDPSIGSYSGIRKVYVGKKNKVVWDRGEWDIDIWIEDKKKFLSYPKL